MNTPKDIVKSILLTTDDTKHIFLSLVEGRSEEIREEIIKYLSQPFDLLFSEVIEPLIWFEGTYEYRYSDKDYKDADYEIKDSTDASREDEVRYRATQIWIERKERELNKFLLTKTNQNTKYLVQNCKIPTFTKSSKVSETQLEALFLKLNELELIREVDSTKFIKCFTEKKLEKQPQIAFYQDPQILYSLFKLMGKYNVIMNQEKSSIFSKNQLFVERDGAKFKTTLRQGLYNLPKYPKDKTKKELVEKLEHFFEKNFTQ